MIIFARNGDEIMTAEKCLESINQYLQDVELCQSLGIGEDGFAEETMRLIKKYSLLLRAESIEKALISQDVGVSAD